MVLRIRKTIAWLGPPLLILLAFWRMDPFLTRNDPDTFFHLTLGLEMWEQGNVIREAIHTFAGSHLPYVPHEMGFQWLLAAFYKVGEWQGVHVLTVLCLGFLFWGLYALVKISRKEMGLEDVHPFLILLIPVVAMYVFFGFFKVRPQMLSAPIIVWFVVVLRSFQMQPTPAKGLGLGGLSLLLSNIHTGVWPVIAVFLIMNHLEGLWTKSLTKHHGYAVGMVLLGGLLNSGGWETLLYFRTVGESGFADWIQEWQPIDFDKGKVFFGILVLYLWSVSHSVKGSLFRTLFALGILYLGITTYKTHLYMVLFLPYFLAVSVEQMKWVADFRQKQWLASPRFLVPTMGLGLVINLLLGWLTPYEQPKTTFPVEEMTFILKDHQNNRPKVLSSYHTSSYVMFRGADILADGRFDPFILDQTKGIHGWTAYERSVYAFESNEIITIMEYDQPDYFIFPKNLDKEGTWVLEDIARDKVHEELGKPVFVGSYGEVFKR